MNTFINIHIRVLFPTPERQLITHACWSFFFQSNYQPEEDSYKPFSTKDEKWIREEFNKKEEDPKKLFELFKVCAYMIIIYRTFLGFGLHFFAFCYIIGLLLKFYGFVHLCGV